VTDGPYSPRLRTGVLLCGTGTAGAYQAGVLKALGEAGVKIDVVAGHGPGAMTALCEGIDGGARLSDPDGPWTNPRLRRAYRWRPALRAGAFGLLAAGVILLSPLILLVVAGVFFVASVGASLVNMPTTSAWLVGWYQRSIEFLFDPPILPTIMPRTLVLAMLVVGLVMALAALQAARQERTRRRLRGAFWWRLIGSPLQADEPGRLFGETLWQLVRGASDASRPAPADIGRRYVDMLADNFGQPGFREVMLAVHDLDARRDVVGGVLSARARAGFEAARPVGGPREAESLDLTGPAREHVVDLLQGALRLPVATSPHLVTWLSQGYWRGETHRLCDRPELAARLVEELAAIGVEQLVVVSPAAYPAVPHAMRSRPMDLRARMGELVRSMETAVLDDAAAAARTRCAAVFVIRPDHNPVGPFDFEAVYDEASDRFWTVGELVRMGYEDAYRTFIEPAVATEEA